MAPGAGWLVVERSEPRRFSPGADFVRPPVTQGARRKQKSAQSPSFVAVSLGSNFSRYEFCVVRISKAKPW